MNIILNIDDQRFSLNGIKYFKNFMGHVVGENLRILNAYDSKFQLLAWTKYDEFTVDGSTFPNISDLQDALLPVLYSRGSLGSEGGGGSVPSTTPAEQLIYFGSGAIALTAGANTQATEVAQHINNIGFTITPGISVMFSTTIKRTINGQAKSVEKRWRFKKNNLEGTHGTGSTHGPIVYTDLIENGYERVLTAIGEDDDYINLGNIGSDTIEDFINAVDPVTVPWENLANDGTEYYFECILNGDSQIYKYVGDLPATMGTGGDVVAAIDFDLISSSGSESTSTEFDLAATTHEAIEKSHFVDADEFPIWDSVTGLLRKLTGLKIKETLEAFFNTKYTSLTSATTGTNLSFTKPVEWNPYTAPSAANITYDLTGALKGQIQKVYHNHTVAPTVPVGTVIIGGEYTVSVLNIMYFEWCGGTRVELWIIQES